MDKSILELVPIEILVPARARVVTVPAFPLSLPPPAKITKLNLVKADVRPDSRSRNGRTWSFTFSDGHCNHTIVTSDPDEAQRIMRDEWSAGPPKWP